VAERAPSADAPMVEGNFRSVRVAGVAARSGVGIPTHAVVQQVGDGLFVSVTSRAIELGESVCRGDVA